MNWLIICIRSVSERQEGPMNNCRSAAGSFPILIIKTSSLPNFNYSNKNNMAPLNIIVKGSSSLYISPEQAVLSLYVKSEGASQDTVSQEVTSTINQLQRSLNELKTASPAPITTFSTSSLRTGSEVPWDRDGNPRERVYYGQISLNVTFCDLSRLGELVGRLSAQKYVEINNIDWRLTDETTKANSSKARKLAMQDATEKARDYAEFLGREVQPVEVTDSEVGRGYMGARYKGGDMVPLAAMGAGGEQHEDLDLTPQEVEVQCSVQVNFKGD